MSGVKKIITSSTICGYRNAFKTWFDAANHKAESFQQGIVTIKDKCPGCQQTKDLNISGVIRNYDTIPMTHDVEYWHEK